MMREQSPTGVLVDSPKKAATPLHIVRAGAAYERFRSDLPEAQAAYLAQAGFAGRAGQVLLLPGDVASAVALLVVGEPTLPWDYAALATKLPRGLYQVLTEPEGAAASALALGFVLGSYRFERYKKEQKNGPQLVWPAFADRAVVTAHAEAFFLARDLINTPASDLGPAELGRSVKQLAKLHGAEFSQIEGDALLAANYPMIHAVGRASSRAPRLCTLEWGKKKKHPRVTLVGKGVCFDTGGLDLKPAAFMKLMKKDMGGAAFVLALAHVIMSRRLPVRLRVLVPAVENSVSGDAMRPLDVLASRKGLTVEIGDTDAEGRLILADALADAEEEEPELLIDAATLTGAARVALGTAMPAIFAHSDESWAGLERAARETDDPLWRLPLHKPYRNRLDSSVADLNNVGTDSYAGAITAALFLAEFVGERRDWVHMDTMGYNLESRLGRPPGGEALGLLAFDRWLVTRYGAPSEPAEPPTEFEATEEGTGVTTRPRTSARARTSAKKKSPAKRSSKSPAKKASPRAKSQGR
ncbi:MAG TPA: leucyl aminopeptidase family protein [Polyangiaceae bacterium]|nr:leucyl aminopeptidase family protein [Polyangiaceae bacterium]